MPGASDALLTRNPCFALTSSGYNATMPTLFSATPYHTTPHRTTVPPPHHHTLFFLKLSRPEIDVHSNPCLAMCYFQRVPWCFRVLLSFAGIFNLHLTFSHHDDYPLLLYIASGVLHRDGTRELAPAVCGWLLRYIPYVDPLYKVTFCWAYLA